MSLSITAALLQRIRNHGQATYPNECCGLLLGTWSDNQKKVTRLRPVENIRDDSPRNRYLIDPAALLAGEKEAQEAGLDVVGIYHSHPDHPARPSEFDRENAFPFYSYIIVKVAEGVSGDLTSWTLREDRSIFDQEEILTSR